MRIPIIVLLGALGISTSVGIASAKLAVPAPKFSVMLGCGSTTAADSAGFLAFIRDFVSSPIVGYRTHSGLPALPADSVSFGGTSVQCDSVTARYNALRTAETGVAWTSVPVLMLRVGPTHWVADPKVEDIDGHREWIILDSTFTIIKVLRTTGSS